MRLRVTKVLCLEYVCTDYLAVTAHTTTSHRQGVLQTPISHSTI